MCHFLKETPQTIMKLVTVTLLVAMATLAMATIDVVEGINKWNTWPSIRLPKMSIKMDKHEADGLYRESRQIQDMDHDLDDIEMSLSYQETSAKNLSEVLRTKITIEDAKGFWLNLKELSGEKQLSKGEESSHVRQRRDIFGADTRYQITDEFKTMFPFSAVAQLSSGCSGILIGPKHVLTAAECIHNGRRYRGKAKNLLVGVVSVINLNISSGNIIHSEAHDLDWFEVDRIFLPSGWIEPRYGKKRDSYNYAVLKLVHNHNLNCMGVGVSSEQNTKYMQRIHYSSFDDYKYYPTPVLTYRHCRIVRDTTNYLYEKCDSTKFSAGAGVYLRMWDSKQYKWSRRVMAVKTWDTEKLQLKNGREKIHRDVRLTLLNFGQICYWVMGDFEACSRGTIEDACLMN